MSGFICLPSDAETAVEEARRLLVGDCIGYRASRDEALRAEDAMAIVARSVLL